LQTAPLTNPNGRSAVGREAFGRPERDNTRDQQSRPIEFAAHSESAIGAACIMAFDRGAWSIATRRPPRSIPDPPPSSSSRGDGLVNCALWNAVRRHTGSVSVPVLNEALGRLARDVFPLIDAVSAEPHRIPMQVGSSALWLAITRALFRSPAMEQARLAVRDDRVIGAAVDGARLYRGTAFGSAEVLRAEVLPVQFVKAACIGLLVRGLALTVDGLAEASARNAATLRAGLAGDEIEGLSLTAFSAHAVRTGSAVYTPWGELVGLDRLAGEIWNDPPGRCTAVLATPVCMRLEALAQEDPHPGTFAAEAYRIAQLVSYGVTLGTNPEDPAAAVPLHTSELLPWGVPGWGGEVRTLGMTSRSAPITSDEADEAARWMADLGSVPLDRIQVALRRLVRALAERTDHQDQLIDAVIAWENLVEHRDKPTASVLWGMRKLAGPAGWSKTRIGGVYETRSAIVHGEQPDHARIAEHAPQAIRIGLDALRTLITNHPGTLAMNSEERVTALGYTLPEPVSTE